MTVAVPAIPTAPQASDPDNFEARADAFLAALPGVIAAQNAQNAENNAIAAALPAAAAAAAAAAPGSALATKMDKDNPVGAAALLGGACVGITFATMETAAAWHIATLPSSNDGTYDGLLIEGFLGHWTASKSVFKVSAKNRGGFLVHYHDGTSTGESGLEFYGQTDGSVNVYMVLRNATYSGALRMDCINCTLYPVPAQVSVPSSGTLLWSQVGSTAVGGGAAYTHPATHLPSVIAQDANNRFVTDVEKASWNSKLSPGGIKTINGESIEGPGNILLTGGGTAGEPVISPGTVAQYWRGDKSWSDFAADVRAVLLAGLGAGSNVAIAVGDSLLVALAKLQAQITALANGKISTGGLKTINNTPLEGIGNIAISGTTTPYYTATPTSGNTYVLDVANGLHQKVTITGSAVPNISFTGWPANGTSAIMLVDIVNGGGAATVTWPATMGFLMPNGSTGLWSAYLSAYGFALQTAGTDRLLVMTQAGNTALLGKLVR